MVVQISNKGSPHKQTVIPLHQGKLFVGNVSADLSEEDGYPR